jgi:hypothetical protein
MSLVAREVLGMRVDADTRGKSAHASVAGE